MTHTDNQRDHDLGETRVPLIPLTHRMDNHVPGHGVQPGDRRFWEYPVPFVGARLVRLDVLVSEKGLAVGDIPQLTVTLVDRNGEELHRDIPLIVFLPYAPGKSWRPRYFKPFDWDPYKSFVTQVGTSVVNKPVEFLAYFVK